MAKTSRPMVRIHNIETNEVIDREMNDAEFAQMQDEQAIQAAAAEASKRPLGDAWAWNRRNASNITPLVAVTLARYGVTNTPEEKPIVRSRVF